VKKFFHPYMQAFTMFAGEAVCIILFVIANKRGKSVVEEGKIPHKPWIFIIPALADSCSSILQYMGLSFISGSTYMMFKGASIVTTAIFSKILIKMVLEKRHFVGCGMAILGITIVGSSGFL
jgi:drug/metabolite transporter (DMT)-like permease